MPKVIFVIRQIGPYHHDRFQALAKNDLDVLVLESMPQDKTYSWETQFGDALYKRHDLPGSVSRIKQALKNNTVFICGWYDKAMLKVLFASLLCKCKRIIISDSRKADTDRTWHKELVKKIILMLYDAALVAGTESREYLKELGFKKPIEQPWDVIDESKWTPKTPVEKENYWVFPARFIEEKQHIQFFKKLCQDFSNEAFPLLYCVGDGPMLLACKSWVKQNALESKIKFFGFLSQEKLIPIMQKAHLCVLPSKKDTWGLVVNESLAAGTPVFLSENCGAKELIDEGENGRVVPSDLSLKSILTIRNTGVKIKSGFLLKDFVSAVSKLKI